MTAMYQLTQLADDRQRQRLADAEEQRPAHRALALARATRRAERAEHFGGCTAPPARPGGCAPSSTPRPAVIGDSPALITVRLADRRARAAE